MVPGQFLTEVIHGKRKGKNRKGRGMPQTIDRPRKKRTEVLHDIDVKG